MSLFSRIDKKFDTLFIVSIGISSFTAAAVILSGLLRTGSISSFLDTKVKKVEDSSTLSSKSISTLENKIDDSVDVEKSSHSTTNKSIIAIEIGKNIQDCIYLDYNATTPVFPEVYSHIIPFLKTFYGNPSSSHTFSAHCREAIILSREHVGNLINAKNPKESIFFTSCGSESDNRAIDIALHNYTVCSTTKSFLCLPNVITSSIEHPAIILYLRHLESLGKISLDILPVDNEGFVDPKILEYYIKVNTALVTIMHSNNEVGTIQPIREISRKIKCFNKSNNTKVVFHSDAAQSIGKVVVDVEALGLDMMTIVGHKFGAPKGIAALYIRESVEKIPMLFGGGQESGWRAGTENVAYISGFGEACRIAAAEADERLMHMLSLKLLLITRFRDAFKGEELSIRFNGPARCNSEDIRSDLQMMKAITMSSKPRISTDLNNEAEAIAKVESKKFVSVLSGSAVEQLPNTVSVSFKNIKADKLMKMISDKVACSVGSACHSEGAGARLSPVLAAMGVPLEFGLGTLRLSFGRHSTVEEIEMASEIIASTVKALSASAALEN